MGPKLAGVWAEKLVHNMSSGLPCQTQVLGPNEVGSEFGDVPLPPHYDDDATVYSTCMCHQKLTGTQISLLSRIKQKIKWKKTKN